MGSVSNLFFGGAKNHLRFTHTIDPGGKNHSFNTEIIDVPIEPFNSILEIFRSHLSMRQTKTVEVLYSGGLDSECVLVSCNKSAIPVQAITMRLLVNNCPINTHDLYYSEKFCRERNIYQRFVDLDIRRFFENGDHLPYLEPYLIIEPHVATHFWLLEQCSHFPVIGGEYSWPQLESKVLSPHRYSYAYTDKFMLDRGIPGIGNMLNHSLESNLEFIKNHIAMLTLKPKFRTDPINIPHFKQALLERMGFGKLELRLRSYGWENTTIFDKRTYQSKLHLQHGFTKNSITWNNQVAILLGGELKYNDKF